MNKSFKKNMLWNMIGSLSYVFASMFLAIIVTRLNGLEEAGAFGIAFSLSNLLLCVANYATRTFHVTETKLKDKDFAFHRVFSSSLMILLTIAYALINEYTGLKLYVLLLFILYKLLEAISEVNYAVMQKKNDLYKVGISLFTKAVGGITLFYITDILTKNLITSLIVLIIYTVLIILFYDLKVLSKYKKEKSKLSIKNVLTIFKTGFSPFLFTFLSLYVMSAPRFALDGVLDDKYQSIYTILMLPATIIILLSQFMIQPFLTILKEKMIKKDYKNFKKIIRNIIFKVIIFMSILTLISYFYGETILGNIYSVDLSGYQTMIVMVIVGASLCGITYILSAALTTVRSTLSQSIIYILVSILTFILSSELINSSGMYGAILAYLITMIVLITLYLVTYIYKINKVR